MSNEEGTPVSHDEAPKKSSAGFAIAFFLVPLLLLIAFSLLTREH